MKNHCSGLLVSGENIVGRIGRLLCLVLVSVAVIGVEPVFSDAEWTLSSTTGPSPRSHYGLVYDEERQITLLYGGLGESGVVLSDMWSWDGNNWTEIIATGPGKRYAHGMVYDSDRKIIVVHGGYNQSISLLNDTWEWDGANWTQIITPGPTPRIAFGMAYDACNNSCVLYGGYVDGGSNYNETWVYDGTWTQKTSSTNPGYRNFIGSGMAYDAARQQVILFGGQYASAGNSDTWAWDGNDWSKVSSGTPQPRWYHAIAYHSGLQKVFMYGGADLSARNDELWAWDGSTWEYKTEKGPQILFAHSMVYDSNRNKLIVFGGLTDGNPSWAYLNETWEYGLDEGPALYLKPTNLNVHRNQDIEIAVNISNASGVIGYRVALDLDPSKVTYIPGSATKVGTSTENGWGPLVVNSSSPALAIFTCASATGTLASGAGSLMKFQLHVNDTLADFTPISVSFTPLTSLNEDAIAFSLEIWSATVLGSNHQPSFNGGSNQVVLEDSVAQEIIGWASGISVGPAYEAWQDLNFTLDIDNSSLFFIQPVIDVSGTLRYTLASDEYGICNATAVLHDSGGNANGGIDSSTPYIFSITVEPVNDAPSFIAGATVVVLNATGGQQIFPAWATAISSGPANESSQSLWFYVETSNPELFSATPTIDAGGTLRFTPNAGAHGVIDATATLYDSGGIANGGINKSPLQQFVIKIYISFMWGDLNDNAQAGSVDASLLLQYNAVLIDSFPGYPVFDYPEYYPDSSQPWLYFPIAADVNDDDVAGTLDASLVLQKYALLIDWFPADTDHDQWGSDEPLPAGKASKRQTVRNVNVLFEQQGSSWIVTFQIDDADNVQGLRVVLSYNPDQLQFDGSASGWLVQSGLLAVNDSEPGRLIFSGALGTPLQEGLSNLMSVKFDIVGNLIEPLLLQIDEQQTQVNDGQIRINLNYPEAN